MLGRADRQRLQHVPAQAPAIGVADVVDPAPDAGIELGKADLAGVIGGQPRPQPPVAERTLRALTRRWVGMDDEAEPRDPASTGSTCARRLVDDEAQAREPLDDRRLPRPELALLSPNRAKSST